MKPMIDWSVVCNNLRRDYKSLSAIAPEVGSDGRHLNRLARGEVQQPKFDVGHRLLDLHLKHCGLEKHQKIPSQY